MRTAVPIAAAIITAGAASAAYQRAAEAADRHRYPPPGRLVDIGGRHMHMLQAGSGSPAVVIVPALGSNVLEWVRVMREVTEETTVCAYDRAGLGWSDPAPGPVTIDAMADDLHALLKAAGIRPPYIIGGQSMGGVVARRFQSRYPGDVAGMLLIDSSHEDQVRRLGATSSWPLLRRVVRRQARILGAYRLGVHLGLVKGFDAASLDWETVPEYQAAAKAVDLSSRQRRTVVGEMLLLARSQGQPQNLGALPLTVLSAGNPERREWPGFAAWSQLQDELAALSSEGVHAYAINANHNVHLDDPAVVADVIGDLVRRCR